MRKLLKDLLSENGTVSSTRLIYIIGHLVIFVMSMFLVLTSGVNMMNLSLISMLSGSLNGTKLVQKKMEKENNDIG